jgi:DNA-binding PadR family transcriptional regulator
MIDEITRDLTLLEYKILGLISYEPTTGYGLLSLLDVDAQHSSASPGSIYPALKRMEKQGLIAGQLEIVRESRARKWYRTTPLGEQVLDRWVRSPLSMMGQPEERETLLTQFLFTAKRLTRDELLAWLDDCDRRIEEYNSVRRAFFKAIEETGQAQLHHQLLWEAKLMEMDMQRTWIKRARDAVLNAESLNLPLSQPRA